MDKIIVGSPNLEGNIGSCESKVVSFQKNFYTRANIVTNSCTGRIVQENTYFDFHLFFLVFVVIFMFWMLKGMADW